MGVVQSQIEAVGVGLSVVLFVCVLVTSVTLLKMLFSRRGNTTTARVVVAVGVVAIAVAAHGVFVWMPLSTDRLLNALTKCEQDGTSAESLRDYVLAGRSFEAYNNSICVSTRADFEAHERLPFVADLHCDALLWPKRDLTARNRHGHVDLPRLAEGNIALQVFALVTGVPKKMNMISNAAPSIASDSLTLKFLIELQPWAAISTRMGRAIVPALRLERLARQSHGQLMIIRTSNDLRALVARRADARANNHQPPAPTGALLAVEGAHVLDGNGTNADVLFQHGVRLFGLAHFFDTEFGGSSAGHQRGGLTTAGRALLDRLDQLGIIVDLAHASLNLIDDVLQNRAAAAASSSSSKTRPPIVSHTAMNTLCESPRNLQDHHAKRIAELGGLIGVAFFRPALCAVDGYPPGDPVQEIVAQIDYAVELVGIQHVALGSDWDGAVSTAFDAANLAVLTGALKTRGYTSDQLERLMGGNVLDFLLKHLPRNS